MWLQRQPPLKYSSAMNKAASVSYIWYVLKGKQELHSGKIFLKEISYMLFCIPETSSKILLCKWKVSTERIIFTFSETNFLDLSSLSTHKHMFNIGGIYWINGYGHGALVKTKAL